jgi:hypothetical protein
MDCNASTKATLALAAHLIFIVTAFSPVLASNDPSSVSSYYTMA